MKVVNNDNNTKYILLIFISLIVICVIIAVISSYCDRSKDSETDNKPILYRYNIEDYDYTIQDVSIYKIEYTGKINGIEYDNKVIINLYAYDNSCFYSGSATNSSGGNYITSTSCTFTIDGDKVSIKSKNQNLYEPSDELKKYGYKTQKNFEDLDISGVLSEKGKYLTIEDNKYTNASYDTFIHNNILFFLIDPSNNDVYKLNGLPLFAEEEYAKENKLDLSKYNIIDKSKNKYEEYSKDDTDESTVTGVELDQSKIVLLPKGSTKLFARVLPEDSESTTLTWKSSDEGIVIVNGDGEITAVNEGKAIVTVLTPEGYSAECIVMVVNEFVRVKNIKANKTSIEIRVNESISLKNNITIFPSDSTNKEVTWKSNDLSIVKVDNNGKIIGVKKGKTAIIVESMDGGYTTSIEIIVK